MRQAFVQGRLVFEETLYINKLAIYLCISSSKLQYTASLSAMKLGHYWADMGSTLPLAACHIVITEGLRNTLHIHSVPLSVAAISHRIQTAL